jgi:hypothetical protein
LRKAVDLIHEGTAHMDRVYAEGLAERMGMNQAAVSRIESRDDLLLSTLAEYAAAAGGVDVELSLDRYQPTK